MTNICRNLSANRKYDGNFVHCSALHYYTVKNNVFFHRNLLRPFRLYSRLIRWRSPACLPTNFIFILYVCFRCCCFFFFPFASTFSAVCKNSHDHHVNRTEVANLNRITLHLLFVHYFFISVFFFSYLVIVFSIQISMFTPLFSSVHTFKIWFLTTTTDRPNTLCDWSFLMFCVHY